MRFLFILAAILTPLTSSLHAQGKTITIIRADESFTSAGKDIRIETFRPEDDTNATPLVVLHGSTGVEFANRFIATVSQHFAAQGFKVYLIHYFDRTGTKQASDRLIRSSFEQWQETVHDAVTYVKRQSPGTPLGVFGYSLGGYLAAAMAVRNADIGAAVVLAGGLDEVTAQVATRSAPTLILHGDQDTRVPITEGKQLQASLQGLGASAQMHVYQGEGHIMQKGTYLDVISRASTFFRRQLGN